MEISVRMCGPGCRDTDISCLGADYEVSEKNRAFGPMPQDCSSCIADQRAKTIFVTVPPKLPGVTCQTDTDAFLKLVRCYEAAVAKAVSMGASSVAFRPLGTEYHRWKHVQSASAARKAMENIAGEAPDSFRAFFTADKKNFQVWDDVLDF